ncbi:uncharacterized protein LOC143022214 [Oratosquilla oratoria]|uniref:uncharacterized protein LOC143022214 n=1 Tax=Oratosquilla oratoria TaxID=337810 RepID=UPI003F75C95D
METSFPLGGHCSVALVLGNMKLLTVVFHLLVFLSVWTIVIHAKDFECDDHHNCTMKKDCRQGGKPCGTDMVCCPESYTTPTSTSTTSTPTTSTSTTSTSTTSISTISTSTTSTPTTSTSTESTPYTFMTTLSTSTTPTFTAVPLTAVVTPQTSLHYATPSVILVPLTATPQQHTSHDGEHDSPSPFPPYVNSETYPTPTSTSTLSTPTISTSTISASTTSTPTTSTPTTSTSTISASTTSTTTTSTPTTSTSTTSMSTASTSTCVKCRPAFLCIFPRQCITDVTQCVPDPVRRLAYFNRKKCNCCQIESK